jgi:hypothetical protein
MPTEELTAADPVARMTEMVYGYSIAQGVYVITRLGIPDLLAGGARPPAELAKLTECHEPSLTRLLRMLADAGVVGTDDAGRFTSTPLSDTLRTDRPGTMASFVSMSLGRHQQRAWGELLHCVRTGQAAYQVTHNATVWQVADADPEFAEQINDSMAHFTETMTDAVARAYDFAPYTSLVDVGGGKGGLLATVLRNNPGSRGTVLDLPHVAESARGQAAGYGLGDRLEFVGGSFFDAVPPGGDLYLLKWVLHDWDDAQCVAILKNCRAVMTTPGARLLVIEQVLPPTGGSPMGRLVDLNMLVSTGGRERTREEFAALLAEAGLTITRVLPTASQSSVIEAAPA